MYAIFLDDDFKSRLSLLVFVNVVFEEEWNKELSSVS